MISTGQTGQIWKRPFGSSGDLGRGPTLGTARDKPWPTGCPAGTVAGLDHSLISSRFRFCFFHFHRFVLFVCFFHLWKISRRQTGGAGERGQMEWDPFSSASTLQNSYHEGLFPFQHRAGLKLLSNYEPVSPSLSLSLSLTVLFSISISTGFSGRNRNQRLLQKHI